jgi:hypothetical protein
VQIISSATETARDVAEALRRRGQLAVAASQADYRFATTALAPEEFVALGSAIFRRPIDRLSLVTLEELAELRAGRQHERGGP